MGNETEQQLLYLTSILLNSTIVINALPNISGDYLLHHTFNNNKIFHTMISLCSTLFKLFLTYSFFICYTGCLFYDFRYLMIHIFETSTLFLASFSGISVEKIKYRPIRSFLLTLQFSTSITYFY